MRRVGLLVRHGGSGTSALGCAVGYGLLGGATAHLLSYIPKFMKGFSSSEFKHLNHLFKYQIYKKVPKKEGTRGLGVRSY